MNEDIKSEDQSFLGGNLQFCAQFDGDDTSTRMGIALYWFFSVIMSSVKDVERDFRSANKQFAKNRMKRLRRCK